ncbi:hypothetical protein [Paenibacillus sp. Root52]|uniref:hypothetical protein n=1 Tax=Paenibacillus sp. Root52 TaxID=1736552 RepID=UPI000A69FB67|nr:hypothetical protein [Paenibacillus sp. Root52]
MDKLTEDKIHSIITELDMVLLTPLPIPTQTGRKEKCFDLWLDKGETIYRLQSIYLLDGKAEEFGQTVGYSKTEITRTMIALSAYD